MLKPGRDRSDHFFVLGAVHTHPLGRQAVESHRDKEAAQTLYHGFVKWREADHDPAVYKLYQKAADDIGRSRGRVTRVVLDFELKRSLNCQFARTAGVSPEEQARRKQEIAEEHGLKVIDGRAAGTRSMTVERELIKRSRRDQACL